MRQRRSSLQITLVLIGATAVSGCGDEPGDRVMRRDVYASIEDCRAEWDRESDCEPVRDGSRPAGHYFGPRYFWSSPSSSRFTSSADHWHSRPREGSRAISTSPVTRSGFGASSRSHGVSSS